MEEDKQREKDLKDAYAIGYTEGHKAGFAEGYEQSKADIDAAEQNRPTAAGLSAWLD